MKLPNTFNFSLEKARQMIRNYAKRYPDETVRAQVFDRDIIEDILKQPDCCGLRIYYALNDDGSRELVVLGTDKQMNDIICKDGTDAPPVPGEVRMMYKAAASEQYIVFKPSKPCPNMCGEANLLTD
jgi:hypothetical protein